MNVKLFKTCGFRFLGNVRYRIPTGSIKCGGSKNLHGYGKFNTRNTTVQLSENKLKYSKYLTNMEIPIIICTGPTGTGKTFSACDEGLTQLLEGKYKKILVTRPTVSVENEQLGFLPGNLDKKMDPWVRPVYDNLEALVGIKEVEQMVRYKIIEICPIAYLRGRTFNDTFIIADEMQNSTKMQFQTLLTRVGQESKIVVNGDLEQSDNVADNGLYDFIKRLHSYLESGNQIKYIAMVNLQQSDIIRHPCVSEILNVYSYLKKQV
jgi:phosphate starvation-inducible PhoH-like protein